MVLSSSIEVRSGSEGLGLYALADIKNGEKLWWASSDDIYNIMTRDEILALPDAEKVIAMRFSYMLGWDRYSTTLNPSTDHSWYWNHSCDPNCGYKDDETVVAIRDIKAGEQLTYDYAFTETTASFHANVECLCRSKKCRGTIITGKEHRSREWIEEHKNHVSTFVKTQIQATGYHHPGLRLRSKMTGKGRGVITTQNIAAGATIGYFTGTVMSREELSMFTDSELTYCIQISDSHYQVSKPGDVSFADLTDFINHSCDPNCSLPESVHIIARRDIQAGEEITLDYALMSDGTVSLGDDTFQCQCGSFRCRGTVTPLDWKLPSVYVAYKPDIPPFLKKKMKAFHKSCIKRNGH